MIDSVLFHSIDSFLFFRIDVCSSKEIVIVFLSEKVFCDAKTTSGSQFRGCGFALFAVCYRSMIM
jgi:hypothetical protein